MGMAASQARYLALTARKSNTEYEGQQINQARTALANQSANLFNRLLGLEVPIAPKTTDYTEIQYSYSDGNNDSVIEEWTQLASPNPNANYLVKHYYYIDKYTGGMKQLKDPQVKFNTNGSIITTNSCLEGALNNLTTATNDYNTAQQTRVNLENEQQNRNSYSVSINIKTASVNNNTYTITDTNNNTEVYTNYASATPAEKNIADNIIVILKNAGAIEQGYDINNVYINSAGEIALKSDLEKLYGVLPNNNTFQLPKYETNYVNNENTRISTALGAARIDEAGKLSLKTIAENNYNSLKLPTHIGNCELTLVDPNNTDDMTQIKQIVKDMEAEDINTNIRTCFDSQGNYTGGIYTFQMNGEQYFTTYEELYASYDSNTGPNDIDGQIPLTYYNTSYIKTKVEQTNNALLETDANGRFKSVKFDNDSIVYQLNTETVTDDAAYQDAMNEYNYKREVYEKKIADINARTSIIQEEDRTLELRLKQLDTEQKALTTEMEAVKKIIKDNIDKTFKTFSD